MLRAIITIFLFQIASTAWAGSYVKWYKDSYHGTSCGEYTPSGDLIARMVQDSCRSQYPVVLKWYTDSYYGVSCAEYSPDEGLQVGRIDPNKCREVLPTTFDWYKDSYHGTSCGEYSPEKLRVQRVSLDICRGDKNTNITQIAVNVETANRNLRPPEGSQVILSGDLAVPRNQGCAAPQDTNKPYQCYVCQSQSSRNSMLYTKDGILGIGTVHLLDSRDEIRIGLVDSDDLGTIRCMTKNKAPIQIQTLEELMKALAESGLKFKDPGFVVKTIGLPRGEP